MELKLDQKIVLELKEKGYNVEEMKRIIFDELMEYDFEGSQLFDLFFEHNGEQMLAQGKVGENGVARCYGVFTSIMVIESEQ
ncbi:hypothetical protein [Gudongella sp. SC589]|jgi:hypothetical protein|uniref:hypothetical protein n=1 Tax=Gudongella sp. SC589 TaxID=3385990 RepID=UPI0039046505